VGAAGDEFVVPAVDQVNLLAEFPGLERRI
jgi:hypothetical protein